MITCRAHRCENRLTLRDGESERAEMEVKLFYHTRKAFESIPAPSSSPFSVSHTPYGAVRDVFFALPCFSIIYHYTVDQRMCKLELKYIVFSSQLSSVQY